MRWLFGIITGRRVRTIRSELRTASPERLSAYQAELNTLERLATRRGRSDIADILWDIRNELRRRDGLAARVPR